MFSARTSWNLGATPLAAAIAQRRVAGALLDLTESNPTRVGLGCPGPMVAAALSQAPGRYDPEPLGLSATRGAIAEYHACRLGPEVADPRRVVVTASTSEAYAFLFKLLADPGDEVLVPSPSYPLFEFLAGLEGVKTVPYPLGYDGEWHLDQSGLQDAVREHPRLRAIVVVSPHNPVGAFLKRDELGFLADVAADRGLALVGDEVFSDYPLQAVASAASVVEQDRALAFLLSGASKVLAAPGLKVGWMLAGGPAVAVEQALQRLEVVADTYLSVSTAAQWALPQLLSARERIQRPLGERLQQNLASLRALHHPGSAWEPLRSEGGWSVVLRVPNRRSEQEWVLALLEDGVLVQPGYFFDFPRPGYLVLSLLGPPGEFEEGLRRAARLLDAA